MKKIFSNIVIPALILVLIGCGDNSSSLVPDKKVRPLRDTIGFAQYAWQMDSIMARLNRNGWSKVDGDPWKMAICPHDDYTYVGSLYPETLGNIKADRVIIIGVAHRAAQLGIEDSLVFETNTHWKGPWGDVPVSAYRNDLIELLDDKYAMISDTMHRVEHSLESLVPYLQYFNRDVEIVPILVPTMNPDRMQTVGQALAKAISSVAEKNNWTWGEDFALVVTTDAVHYGTEGWNGNNNARFGCEDEGNQKARDLEAEIVSSTLKGIITIGKARKFSDYTLNPDNYREYIWTWCGRYCIPTTLYTTYYMAGDETISGELIGYSTSITVDHVPVDDLSMGRTAIATNRHWVGYAALGYR